MAFATEHVHKFFQIHCEHIRLKLFSKDASRKKNEHIHINTPKNKIFHERNFSILHQHIFIFLSAQMNGIFEIWSMMAWNTTAQWPTKANGMRRHEKYNIRTFFGCSSLKFIMLEYRFIEWKIHCNHRLAIDRKMKLLLLEPWYFFFENKKKKNENKYKMVSFLFVCLHEFPWHC